MPAPRIKLLVTALFICGITLSGSQAAFGQVAGDPYKKAGPADAVREFVASHVGQPRADETLDELKKLYDEAARYYVTNSTGRIYLRTEIIGAGEPLSWQSFGAGLKSGQLLIVRLTETPDPTLDAPKPNPQVVEYTVRWLPADAKAPLATPKNSAAAQPAALKKAAADVVAYIATLRAEQSSFLRYHSGFTPKLEPINSLAEIIVAQDGDPTPDQVQALTKSIHSASSMLITISKRPVIGTPEAAGAARVETAEYLVTAKQMADQFTDLTTAITDAAPEAVTPPPPAAAPAGP